MGNNFNQDINPELFQKVIENVPIGIIIFSASWEITFVNDNLYQFSSLYQINTTSLHGSNILEYQIFPSYNISNSLKKLEEGYSFETEIENLKTADGRISVVVKGSPIFENGAFSGGILIIEDLKIADKKVSQGELTVKEFEKAFERLNNFLFICNPDGNIKLNLGKNIEKLSSRVLKQGETVTIDQIFHKRVQQEFKDRFLSAKDKRISEKLRVELFLEEEIHSYTCIIEPLLTNNEIQFVFVWLNEITDLIIKEKELQRELNKLKQYQYVIDSSVDAIFIIDESGIINFWTNSAEQMFYYSREEIISEFIGQFLLTIDQNYFDKIKRMLDSASSWEGELRARTKNGEEKILYSRFTLTDASEHNIVVICSDVTEKRRIENVLINSEEKFRETFKKAEIPLAILNPEGFIIDANEKLFLEMKYDEKDLINKNIRNIIHPDFIREESFELKSHLNQPKKSLPYLRKNGEKIIFSCRFIPSYHDNKIKFITCFFENVTQSSINEEDKKFFSTLFYSSPEAIAVELNGKIIHSNKSFLNIFGYENQSELFNKDPFDIISNSDIMKAAEYFQKIERKKSYGETLEFTGKRKDSSNFYGELSASTFESAGKFYIVIVVRDITDRKKVQYAITDSEERYRNITENIDGFLYTYERQNNILKPVFFTTSVEKITGYEKHEFIKDPKLLIKIIHPDDVPSAKEKIRGLLHSRKQTSEELEFRIINKSGNIVWVRNKVNLSRGAGGRTEKIYGLISDISLRKKAEEDLIKSTENLVKLNETKDKFISIVSHDLRTPFSSILGFTDLLLNDEGLTDEEKIQYVRYIRDSSKSMLSLVNSLLDWTRLQTGRIKFDLERTDAYSIILKSLNALSGIAFQKNIELISLVKKDVLIFVDEELIGQVFNNLISNAIKFTKEGGHVVISSNPIEKSRFVEFSVKDNGTGIKTENLKYLFNIESKFTSEGTLGEKGSGLGLSLVKEIIEKHSGKIWVETEYGSGSDFKFTLPIASADILLVDDNNTDKLLYSKIIKNITPDYNVEVASNGEEALEKIKNTPPALIITDHNMPVMNGYELVQNIRKMDLKNKPPILILSGDIDRNEIDDYHRIGIEFVFQKPVNLSLFKQAVEKCLKEGLKG